MTREERHIAVLRRLLENMDVYDSIQPTTERKKAIKAAIQALSQGPCDDVVSRGVFEQVMWERDIAIEQLHELGYELGQKIEPCTDAVNREAVIKAITNTSGIRGDALNALYALPSVNPQPCDDAVSRQAVKVWLEEMDNKLNPEKYNTIAEYYAVKAQMQKLIYICDSPKEKSCLNCKYNNENLYRGEHCGDCDECMLWEEAEQLPPVTQKPIECDDAISREAVLLFIEKVKESGIANYGSLLDIATEVRNLPPVTPSCDKCAMNGSGSKYCDNCTQKSESGRNITDYQNYLRKM